MNTATPYGLLRLRDLQLALPLSALREVIPAPAAFLPLPASAPGLLGAVELRDRVIPVVDLGRAIGPGDALPAGRVVAVTVHAGRVLGLLADDVAGIAVVDGDRLQPLAADAPLVLTHAFTRPDDGTVASLLDVEALFRLPGVPSLRDVADESAVPGAGLYQPGASDAAPAGARPLMTMRVGPLLVGIDAVGVDGVLPSITVGESPLTGGCCLGVTRHGELEVPVVDTLAVLGLGSIAADEVRRGIVLRLDHGFVALALTDVLDILSVSPGDLLAVPPLTVRRPDLFVGVLPQAGGQLLLVDVERLRAVPELVGLSGCNTGPGTGPEVSAGPAGPGTVADGDADGYGRAGRSYLTYSIGGDAASLLDQVVEIVPFDPRQAVLGTGQAPVLGFLVHRDGTVPVVDLSALFGRPGQVEAVGCAVLLVHAGAGPIGYLVPELHAIEASVWEEERPAGGVHRARTDLAASPLIQLGAGADQRMVPAVDLVALADLLLGAVPAG